MGKENRIWAKECPRCSAVLTTLDIARWPLCRCVAGLEAKQVIADKTKCVARKHLTMEPRRKPLLSLMSLRFSDEAVPLLLRKLPNMLDTAGIAEDSSSLILEPEAILPSQFFEQIRSESSAQPEKRLMLAVLEDAIATFQKCLPGVTCRQRHRLKEVEEWFASAEVKWPFSFQNICAALNLNAGYLRLGLDRWKARQLAQGQGSAPIRPSSFRRVSGQYHAVSAHRFRQLKRRAA